MVYGQFLQRNSYVSNNQRVAGGDAIFSYPVASSSRVNGIPPQRPTLQLPTSSYRSESPGSSPPSAASSRCTYSLETDLVTPLVSPSFTPSPNTPYHTYRVQGQWDGLDYPQLPQNDLLSVSHSVAGPSRAFPSTTLPSPAVGNPNPRAQEYQRSNLEQPAFGNPVPSPSPFGHRSESTDTQDTAPSFDHRAFVQGGGYQGQSQAMHRPVTLDPRFGSAQQSYLIPNHVRSTPGQSYWDTSRDRYDPFQTLGFNRREIQPSRTPNSSHQNEGVTNVSQYPGPATTHSLSDERFGNGGSIEAVQPNLRFFGMPDHQVGTQHSRRPRKVKKTAGKVKDTTGGNSTPRKRPTAFQEFVVQLTANPVGNRGPVQLISVPQTLYKCPHKQDGWVAAPPIEFWNLTLIVAANPTHNGFHGADERVFVYDGVGSSISCRMKISGRDFGPWKILTTDNKSLRKSTTKGKVAYEVARFVWEHIEEIQNLPGCANLSFQNLVLVRLIHVAKASWQAMLSYEAPVHRPGRS